MQNIEQVKTPQNKRVIEPVKTTEVLERFMQAHSTTATHTANTNSIALANIQKAASEYLEWFKIVLIRNEALDIILPWHLGEGGSAELVPPHGLSVKAVVEKLHTMHEYATTNEACWRKIEFAKTAPLSPVFLSTTPIATDDYRKIPEQKGLFHLDGLHRLIGWEMAGRLEQNKLEAYVAGRPNIPE